MTNDEINEARWNKLKAAAAAIGEDFDNVIILASVPEDGGHTAHFQAGTGDIFAWMGLADAWLTEQRAYHLAAGRLKYRQNKMDNGVNPDGES